MDDLQTLNVITDRVLGYRVESPDLTPPAFSFYEFFSGGGMARAGLGSRWTCLFANDFDHKKSAVYRDNWDGDTLKTGDVGKVKVTDLPGRAGLAWASFPCQDLSLAGMGAGLRGDRSGTFWPFWKLMTRLIAKRRGPRIIVLENVCGTLTSHGGKDFTALADALADSGYAFGAVVIDAERFVPQSRKRLFVVAVSPDSPIPPSLLAKEPSSIWHTKALRTAHDRLSEATRERWVWWKIAPPPKRTSGFVDLLEDEPESVEWHFKAETKRLLKMMSAVNIAKVREAKTTGKRMVGAVYKRTRLDENGEKVQRAEVRFDGVSGCLRTSSGGSSRQLIVVVHGDEVRSRLVSSRETARLMGLPEDYRLPANYNEAYHLTGDGLVVPVVRHLAAMLLEPILAKKPKKASASHARNTVPAKR